MLKKLRAAAAALLVAAAVAVGYFYLRAPESTQVKVGQMAPDLELPSLGGSAPTRLSNFRGNPVLLVMFLSECHICESEIDQVERLHREFLQRGLRVIGVSADPDRATRQAFVDRHGITFIVLEDDRGQALRAAWGSWKLPEAYLIDANGKVVAVYVGSVNWKSPEVREQVQKLLPPREAAPRA